MVRAITMGLIIQLHAIGILEIVAIKIAQPPTGIIHMNAARIVTTVWTQRVGLRPASKLLDSTPTSLTMIGTCQEHTKLSWTFCLDYQCTTVTMDL